MFPSPVLDSIGLWGLRSHAIHKAMPKQAMLWSSYKACFSTKPWSSSSWRATLTIHAMRLITINTQPLRVLSKRINSPPPSICTFSRKSGSTIYKEVRCHTHIPFISLCSRSERKPNPYKSTLRPDNYHLSPVLGENQSRASTLVTHSMWRSSVFHCRLQFFKRRIIIWNESKLGLCK